jgi:type II secretory pathway predicted ATPase ExeA
MPVQNIAGRKPEIKKLQGALHSDQPELIAVYGRRRVGKTYLIREFFDDQICFELTGIHKATLREQLNNFTASLTEANNSLLALQPPGTWQEAFAQLKTFLNQYKSKGKKVVFLDELPWLNTPRSGFLKHLEHFWNSYGSKRKDLVLIVCGSAASWMLQHILDSKGGLHNRISGHIRLLPFSLSETLEYLEKKKIRKLDQFQVLQLYMAMGGVPYYWSFVQKDHSAAHAIDDLFFVKGAPLWEEYNNLFGSLFDHSESHENIIQALSRKKKGLNRNELLKVMKTSSGGTATSILRELETSGFISPYIPFGKKSADALYRISDEFILFHLHWIAPLGKQQAGRGFWIKKQSDTKYHSWSGYSFESICLKHIEQIKYHMRIDMIDSNESPWEYRPNKGSGEQGAQIDLLIDRQDKVINICEMKFSRSEFTITAAYAKDLRRKMEVFRLQTGSRKNLFLTMVTTFGLNENTHSNALDALDIKMGALFEHL